MNRSALWIVGLFLLIVGGFAAWLGPRLLSRRVRPSTPSASPARPALPDPRPPPDAAPPSGLPAARRAAPPLVVTGPDAEVLPGPGRVLRFGGPPHPAGWRGTYVRAEGFGWARIPSPGADGASRVRLVRVAAPLDVTVRDADGRPAQGRRVAYGPDGHAVTTDERGVATIADVAPGVLRLAVAEGRRPVASRRVRAGIDRTLEILLEPTLEIRVRALDETGAPLAGATITAASPSGLEGEPVTTGADGTTTLFARADERLSLVGALVGRETILVEVPLPDPRRPLVADVELRLPKETGTLRGELLAAATDAGPAELRVEPSVLAPIRERFGPEDAIEAPWRKGASANGPFEIRGLPLGVPIRVSVRGDVAPEDHVVVPGEPSARALRIRPDPWSVEAELPGPSAPTEPAEVRGRITDAAGTPFAGLSVATDGARTTTDADGLFVLGGLPRGRAVPLVWGFSDGADTRGVDPGAFAPRFEGTATAGGEPVAVVLPRAAGVRLRLAEGLSGAPLSWARVVALDGDGNVRFDGCVATRGGVAVLSDLVPGTAGSLFAFAPGLRREVPLALRAGEVVDMGEVGLTRGGRGRGVVRDRKGAPIVGAVVAAMEDGRLERGGRGLAFGRDLVVRRTTTDAEGAWTLDGLDTSRPALVGIHAAGYAPTGRRILWNEGEDASVAATLGRGGTVRLQILDPAGGRVGGAVVELEDARSGVRALDVLRRAGLGSYVGSTEDVRRASASVLAEDPDAPGVFRVGPLEPGPWELVVSCPGYASRRAKFTMPDPESGAVRSIPADAFDWRLELTPRPDGK